MAEPRTIVGSPPGMSNEEHEVLSEAECQLSEMRLMAVGEIDGCTPLEQIEMTRGALRAALRVVAAYERRCGGESLPNLVRAHFEKHPTSELRALDLEGAGLSDDRVHLMHTLKRLCAQGVLVRPRDEHGVERRGLYKLNPDRLAVAGRG